jgi:hypothetical protein
VAACGKLEAMRDDDSEKDEDDLPAAAGNEVSQSGRESPYEGTHLAVRHRQIPPIWSELTRSPKVTPLSFT